MPKIQVRRGTATQWSTINPTLAAGEFGYITSGAGAGGFKLGDGALAWNSLGYAASGALSATPAAMTVSNVFVNSGTFNGSSALTLDLPTTIARNAQTASKLLSAVTINGDTFDGSSAVAVSGSIYGTSSFAGATFRDIYVSPSASAPSSPNTGDVWIAF